MRRYRIAVIPGDGIGQEVAQPPAFALGSARTQTPDAPRYSARRKFRM